MLGGSDDRAHVFVGTGRFFGDPTHRRASDKNTLSSKLIDDLAAAPMLRGRMPGHGATCSVTCGREGTLLGGRQACQDVRARSHAAADEHRLPDRAQGVGQARVSRPECARRALAVDEEITALLADDVRFDLAGIVGNVEQKAQIVSGKKWAKTRRA